MKRTVRIGLPLLAAVVLLVVDFRYVRPHSPLLLRHARFVANTTGWIGSWWLDNRRLLVLERHGSSRLSASILDASGRRTPLAGLSRTICSIGADSRMELSPDGTWMVDLPWKTAPHTQVLIRVKDGRIVWRNRGGAFVRWLPDSSGWIGEPWPLFRVSHGPAFGFFRLDGSVRQYGAWPSVVGDDLGLTPSGHPLVAFYNPYARDPSTIREVDLAGGRIIRTTRAVLPPGGWPSELAVSPDGRRLAWTMRQAPESWPLSWIHSLTERSEPDTNDVWVSNVDGSGMREIGEAEVKYGTDYDTDVSVGWLADNAHLSVAKGARLYVVPAG